MATALSQVEAFYLDQPATAVAKNLDVNLGFRPAAVWVINYKAAGAMAIAVDGLEAAATEGGLRFGTNAAMAEVGNDGIYFTDNGIQLRGDTTLIRDNNANIVIIAFRSLRAPQSISLTGIPKTPDKKFAADSEELYEFGVTTET